VNIEYLTLLFGKFDIFANILFNAGFMYTDLTMMVIGIPGYTESDYLYYIMFYVGDFIFRFFFR
jgi:hypothetical protein